MNTSQLGRTTLATSAITATLTLLTAVGAPTASAQIPEPPGCGLRVRSAPSAVDDIGVIVAMRKEAAARYYVQHAWEINRTLLLSEHVR